MNIAVAPELPEVFTRWFASRGWAPRAHQLELLRVARAERSALLIAPTGAGKTLAGFLPSLVELSAVSKVSRNRAIPTPNPSPQAGGEFTERAATANPNRRLVSAGRGIRREGGLHTLYISPHAR
jgi:ATP-dependent Lhr-like helicase